MKRRFFAAWIGVCLLALLHLVLQRVMTDFKVTAAILSPGPHTPVWQLVTAASFLLSRCLLILVAPAYLLGVTGRVLWDKVWNKRQGFRAT